MQEYKKAGSFRNLYTDGCSCGCVTHIAKSYFGKRKDELHSN